VPTYEPPLHFRNTQRHPACVSTLHAGYEAFSHKKYFIQGLNFVRTVVLQHTLSVAFFF